YLATGDSSPYTDGRQDLAAAQQRVHQDLAGLPVDAEVAQVDAAIASWQALADDMERRPAGSDPAGDAFRSGQGSQLLTALDASASALAGSTDPVARQAGAEGTTAWMLGLVVLLAGSGGATGAIRLLMDRLMTGGLIPTGDLEGAAEQVALTGSATIPHLD